MATVGLVLGARSAHAQVDAIDADQRRQRQEQEAAARAARQIAPRVNLAPTKGEPLGPFPDEDSCFPIREIRVAGNLDDGLEWAASHMKRFEGRCIGREGLNYVLKSLQADFLDRGLVTTRAGLPEQDLSSGVLAIQIMPGVLAGVTGGSRRARRAWNLAFPGHRGRLLRLREMEQGLEQMRRLPGAQVKVDVKPGDTSGQSFLALEAQRSRLITGQASINSYAAQSVGGWQTALSLNGADLFGVSDLWTLSYNSRLLAADLPADSVGSGIQLNVPYGWWTAGLAANRYQYKQTIVGEIQRFANAGDIRSFEVTLSRVIHRDSRSKTSIEARLRRRQERFYIDRVEISLQHRDLSDVSVAVIDRRQLGSAQLDTELGYRRGVSWFGAQKDPPNLPKTLPTAAYGIATLDTSLNLPIGWGALDSYRAQARGQSSDDTLFGADLFSVGGPFTVRGVEDEFSRSGRSGWYLRQELVFRTPVKGLSPFIFLDCGAVAKQRRPSSGAGLGLRANWRGLGLDTFVARPLAVEGPARPTKARYGLTAYYGF